MAPGSKSWEHPGRVTEEVGRASAKALRLEIASLVEGEAKDQL